MPTLATPSDSRTTYPLIVLGAVLIFASFLYMRDVRAAALGASEAFSAMAAAKPSIAEIVRTPVLDDPGKQVFYYIALHGWTRIFGLSEVSLRSFSVVFALAAIMLVFAVARELFDDQTAAAAAAMWAFNPVVMVLARFARMYSMFVTIALGHLLMFRRVRMHATQMRVISCGVLGAAMLYTHLGSAPIIGAEIAMLLRDEWQGRRNFGGWLSLAIAISLFAPYAPIAISQGQELISGHALDYLGGPHEISIAFKIAFVLAAAAFTFWLVFGKSSTAAHEPIRWCAIWTLLPPLGFLAGSVLVRALFNSRYVAPGWAGLAIIGAGIFSQFGSRFRNLAAFGVAVMSFVLSLPVHPAAEPWREIAQKIAADGTSHTAPVFFESGAIKLGAKAVPAGGEGYRSGFYSVPFNYYFHGANPRLAVPGNDPASAEATIAKAVEQTGGAWLISWKNDEDARRELPDHLRFRIDGKIYDPIIAVYRITPRQ